MNQHTIVHVWKQNDKWIAANKWSGTLHAYGNSADEAIDNWKKKYHQMIASFKIVGNENE